MFKKSSTRLIYFFYFSYGEIISAQRERFEKVPSLDGINTYLSKVLNFQAGEFFENLSLRKSFVPLNKKVYI